jgi:hypothetical protein
MSLPALLDDFGSREVALAYLVSAENLATPPDLEFTL